MNALQYATEGLQGEKQGSTRLTTHVQIGSKDLASKVMYYTHEKGKGTQHDKAEHFKNDQHQVQDGKKVIVRLFFVLVQDII